MKDIKWNLITPEMKGYLAGLVERGTFSISHKQSGARAGFFSAKMSFRTTSKELAEWCEYFWAANFSIIKETNRYERFSISWGATMACKILREIAPLLIDKKNHSLVLIEYGKLACKRDSSGHLKKMSDSVIAKRKILQESLNALNRENSHQGNINNLRNNGQNSWRAVYANNIFDVFDGVFNEEESREAKSIFDEFLEQG
jgi:hypothetical protein